MESSASFSSRISLSSPPSWDRYGAAGKPYPGANTAEDMSTCPTIAGRLTSALGVKMSYWVGTLPNQGGCTWVPVPLDYDGPYHYAYTLTIAYEGDGSTTHSLRRASVEHTGTVVCPSADVPAAGPGALVDAARGAFG